MSRSVTGSACGPAHATRRRRMLDKSIDGIIALYKSEGEAPEGPPPLIMPAYCPTSKTSVCDTGRESALPRIATALIFVSVALACTVLSQRYRF